MKTNSFERMGSFGKTFWLAAAGLASGMINGLLGAGGGILIVFALGALMRGSFEENRDIYANALCIMLPISAVSCIRYALSGNVDAEAFGIYVIPAIIGGVAGGFLLHRIRGSVLKKLFGALVIWSGVILMIR